MAINKQNLRTPTSEEARRIGSLGGKARARNRLAMEKFKDLLIEGLSREEKLKMLEAIKKNAKKGNLQSFEFLLKMMGEHPDQLNEGNDSVINIKVGVPDDDYRK
jgi:hypothetical protein